MICCVQTAPQSEPSLPGACEIAILLVRVCKPWGEAMTNNLKIDTANPQSTTEGQPSSSYYRLSVHSGSIEVSARLKNSDDLELLLRVLEPNKIIFGRAEAAEPPAKINMSFGKPLTTQKAEKPSNNGLTGTLTP
jgi:hypothetical protein